jgi:hypothetical protein
MLKTVDEDLAHNDQGKVHPSNVRIRSKQPLDPIQKRLLYLLLETIRTTDTGGDFTEIPVHSLWEGALDSSKVDLKAATEGLVGTTFSRIKPTGGWTVTSVFDCIEYVRVGETTERGFKKIFDVDVLRVRLNASISPYLLQLGKLELTETNQ